MLGVLLAVIGVQFICTGIVTEMLARTYYESGNSKTYAVREVLGAAASASSRPGRAKRCGAAWTSGEKNCRTRRHAGSARHLAGGAQHARAGRAAGLAGAGRLAGASSTS